MSLQSEIEITCPKCSSQVSFTKWDSVNVSLDPEQKPKILDSSFFNVTCSTCMTNLFIPYGFLYHDMEQKIMIFFDEDETSKSENETLTLPSNLFFENTQTKYKLRKVHGVNRLKEKILIFDHNLDDVTMERVKFGLTFWLIQQKSLTDYPKIYFNKRNDNTFEFYIKEEGQDGYVVEIEMSLYNELDKLIQLGNANINEGKDIMNIDFDWVYKHYTDK
jgi:hypothetical protein